MSVAVSPDRKTLAIDLQGSIWTLPASGGRATRITDLFEDARQPTWSPDGKWITYFAYRDGNYHLWSISPDGSKEKQLTWGPCDDREPIWSHDGTQIAFSSDRGDPLGSHYNIWSVDIRTGALRQITHESSESYMPTWSPNDREIAFASTRRGGRSVWAVKVGDGTERQLATSGGPVDAPSWGPDGRLVYHLTQAVTNHLESNRRPVTVGENVFPFRATWASPTEFFYVSDGKIRRHTMGDPHPHTIEFSAILPVTRQQYARRKRDLDSLAPRRALGIVHPRISPDGTKVAFAALGDIYVMPIGGKPENVTRDEALDMDPAWSPDGSQLVYSSDKAGGTLQLWVRDLRTGQERQLTKLTNPAVAAAWSPDGTRIAFLTVDGEMFLKSGVSVVDVATGQVQHVHELSPGPSSPTWSADGSRLAVAMLTPSSRRYREGTNQVLTMSTTDGATRRYAPMPTISIDSLNGSGPAWSPDGTRMAAIYEGILSVWPVAQTGEPLAPPKRFSIDMAYSPSWTADSQQILYQSLDKLRLIDLRTGLTRDVPVDIEYTPAIPPRRIVVHAGRLLDMKSATERSNVDILVEGNRIREIVPHSDRFHARGDVVVDASKLTVMPGLIESHTHLMNELGEANGRGFLAFGITTVRSMGGGPYEAVEEREANEAGIRPGPRIYSTGYLFEGTRSYHRMSVAISSPAQFEMELERARILQHDLIKSYVRLPDAQQRRMVEFAHQIGVPVATHELYPAAFVGVDSIEHTEGTSRRGYSPKMATLQRSYNDVARILGAHQGVFDPAVLHRMGGVRFLFAHDPQLKDDPRFKLYPDWLLPEFVDRPRKAPPSTEPDTDAQTAKMGRAQEAAASAAVSGHQLIGPAKMIRDAMRAGAVVVAGTDSTLGLELHGELAGLVSVAGLTPYEALKTATVNAARALNLDAGTIEPGKLADMVFVDGNPLKNIGDTVKVKRVMANGHLYDVDQLIRGYDPMK